MIPGIGDNLRGGPNGTERPVSLRGSSRELVVFGVLHIALFLSFAAIGQAFYPAPGSLEMNIASYILDGLVPYRDLLVEYPPPALLSFLVPALLFRTPVAYAFAFAAELLVFDVMAMVAIASMAPASRITVRKSLALYTAVVAAVGPLVVLRYDLLPAMLVIVALAALVKGKTKTGWALLALGVGAKLYPLVVLPLVAIEDLRARQYRRLGVGVAVFVGVLLAMDLPWVILNAGGFWYSMSYHLERGLHSESLYGTALLVEQVFGLTTVKGAMTFGSWNLDSALADLLARWSLYFTVVCLTIVYASHWWRVRKRPATEVAAGRPDAGATQLLIRYACVAVLVFILANKVFSPQYLIWLCPLLPLIGGRWRNVVWGLFIVAAAATQYVYPYHYIEFAQFTPHVVLTLAARDILLVAAAILMLLPDGPGKAPILSPVQPAGA